jgi:hypothetical protein
LWFSITAVAFAACAVMILDVVRRCYAALCGRWTRLNSSRRARLLA